MQDAATQPEPTEDEAHEVARRMIDIVIERLEKIAAEKAEKAEKVSTTPPPGYATTAQTLAALSAAHDEPVKKTPKVTS